MASTYDEVLKRLYANMAQTKPTPAAPAAGLMSQRPGIITPAQQDEGAVSSVDYVVDFISQLSEKATTPAAEVRQAYIDPLGVSTAEMYDRYNTPPYKLYQFNRHNQDMLNYTLEGYKDQAMDDQLDIEMYLRDRQEDEAVKSATESAERYEPNGLMERPALKFSDSDIKQLNTRANLGFGKNNIDFVFIAEKEGNKKEGYIPKDKKTGEILGNSGVTIGTGFDLGQHSESDLEGLPQTIKDKLKPYLGIKKKAADLFLSENPLILSEEETETINEHVKKEKTKDIIKKWNKASDIPWDSLTKEQATVVASVLYQYGSPSRTPKFWKAATSGDWDKVYKELMNFGDDYPTRRKSEAKYLKGE